ncbi:MAG: hypothetical protein J5506_10855 [Prevotella sp.]|nr:hypothetical protein [Prevotella sp.]
MKKLFTPLLMVGMMLCLAVNVQAQSFKLYFANNISDLDDVRSINEGTANLNWREVSPNGSIVYTNQVEANSVMEMFASTDMKGLTQQQQFWRMRDHSLLCFRINDGNGNDAYGVDATDGNGNNLEITVSRYFYANMPMQEAPVNIRVWKMGEVGDTLKFQYHVHGWNDNNLYIFQLDSKRQADGEEYTMEYVLSYADNNGLLKEDTMQLKLQRNSFQSFYVDDDKELTDVFLTTGAVKNGVKAKKLRINKKRLHPGVGTDNDFNYLTLSPTFHLDRHANRELINFNWIGTGLFESFDTLYVKLRRSNGLPISAIEKINVARVDANGNYVPNNQVKYIGYDQSREAHKVLAMGNPVYLEILAKGFYPAIYRFPGAADPISGIVDEERCTAEVTLTPGNVNYSEFAVSSQHFYGLRDTKKVVVYRGEDHALCDLEDVDLSAQPATTTIFYAKDGGQDGGKLMKGRLIDQYAELVMTFSKTKTTTASIQQPVLVAYDSSTWDEVQRFQSLATSADVVSIPIFTFDYYDVKYDLCDLELDKECVMHLQTSNGTYEKLPMFQRFHFDRSKADEDGNEEIIDNTMGQVTKNDPISLSGAGADSGMDWGIPSNYSWGPDCLKNGPNKLKVGFYWYFSISKKSWEFKASLDFSHGFDGDESISQMRKEQKEAAKWDKWRKKGTFAGEGDTETWHNIDGSLVANGSAVKLEDWIYKEIDDIFKVPTPGHSLGFGLSLSGFLGYVKKDLNSDGSHKEGTSAKFVISEGAGYIRYSYGLTLPNMMSLIGNKLGKPGEWINKYLTKLNLITCSAVWSAGFDLNLSFKNWSAKEVGYDADGWGFLLTLIAKMKTGAWIEMHTPPNPFLHLGAGVRAGLKVAAGFGYGTDFHEHHDLGGMLMAIGIIEAYAYIRACFGEGQARAEAHFGGRWLFPDNNNHNPFHEKYPYWAPKANANAKGNALWTPENEQLAGNALWTPNTQHPSPNTLVAAHPTTSSLIRRAIQAPEDTDFGTPIVTGVTTDANPHYLDENTIVYNDPASIANINDDRISTLNTQTQKTTTISNNGLRANNHMRSKRREHEIVVYEEMARVVSDDDLNAGSDVEVASQLGTQQRIMANIRTEGGEWKNMVIAHNPGMVDAKPIVTIQDDGHAACVWQHGVIKKNTQSDVADNEYYNTYIDGNLVLSIYNGKMWSAPIELHKLDATHTAGQYDLMMRNDTVLVGSNITENILDPDNRKTKFTFASVPLATKRPTYVNEQIQPKRFFMNRVGEHAVITMLYQKNDSLRDIYVKTLSMNGVGDGIAGNDLGVNFCTPELVKIVCDRSATSLNDFAVLWTEVNNTAHGAEGTAKDTGKTRMMLNASRIALDPTVRITAPLTLGAETNELTMTDFDGFLDDQHIKVVYTLSDVASDEALIMQSERFFTNSFRYEVNYQSSSLLSSSTLPVSITVTNTGTSPIKHVTVFVNSQPYSIGDSFIQPLRSRDFVIEYPIGNGFDGYLATQVEVEYDNVFRAKSHARRKSVSLQRQLQSTPRERISMENIEMRLLGQAIEDGANIFTVELTDRSTRGMNPGNEVHVGVFAHPAFPVPVSDGAETIVKATDFHLYGNVRKAYATVRVAGVAETTQAYLNLHLFESRPAGAEFNYVENISFTENAHFVILQPSNDPTEINPVRFRENKDRLSVRITNEENGVRISGLPTGTDREGNEYRVRVFRSSGTAIYSEPSKSESIFVPLNNHDVYLLSTGKDILKFKF